MAAGAYRIGSDVGFPVTGSGRDKLGFAVRHAMLANKQQHWQAVEFHLREQFVELTARDARITAFADSDDREALVQCGMSLQHLKLTLKRHRSFGRVDLFPDLDQPNLAARVHLGRAAARDDFEQQLLNATESGETATRLPAPVSGAAIEWLSRAISGERSWLEFARCEESRQRLVELVRAPRRIPAAEVQVRDEPMVPSADRRWTLTRLTGGRLPERFALWRKPALAIKIQAVEPSRGLPEMLEPGVLNGTFAVVKTKTDDKHGWLAAGQTLAGLLLHAQRLGLPCTPFSDVLREPALRAELRTAIGHKGFMQAIVCFGTPRVDLPPRPELLYPTTETRTST